MALTPKEKQKIIEKVRTHDKDTGSSAVQIGVLSAEITRRLVISSAGSNSIKW